MEERIVFPMDTLLPKNIDDLRSDISTGDKPMTQPRRRPRTSFTQSAVRLMEKEFEINKFPDISRRETMATEIGVPESRVQVWFQNRRARANKRRRSSDDQKPEKRRRRNSINSDHDNKKNNNVVKKIDGVTTFTDKNSESQHQTQAAPGIHHTIPFQKTNATYNHSRLLSHPVTCNFYALGVNVLTSSCQSHFQTSLTSQSKSHDQGNSDVDNFLQGMFRFSTSRATEAPKSTESRQPEVCIKPYILTVPAKKISDCSVNELQTQDLGR